MTVHLESEIANRAIATRRKGDGVNSCKSCGSADLFDTNLDNDGYATSDGSGTWTTICNRCGQDQQKAR